MKRKIIFSLLAVIILSALGSTFAILYIRNTTATLTRLIILHEVEDLHHRMVRSIHAVQSELSTARTPTDLIPELVLKNAEDLEQSSQQCLTCHHEAAIIGQIDRIQSLISDYRNVLSDTISGMENARQVDKLTLDASAVGNELLARTEGMSEQAGNKRKIAAQDAIHKIKRAWLILTGTMIVTLVLGVLVAANLTRAITSPINILVNATRKIASGNLGYTVTYRDKTEFGELASHFNAMSNSLMTSYADLEEEVNERRKAEDALRESEERYALAARGANDGMWDWDLRNNKIHFSVRWKSMLGFGEEEINNNPGEWLDRIHPDDRDEVDARIAAHLSGRDPHFECEYRIMHQDGAYRWMVSRGLAVRAQDGQAYRMAGSQTDITSRKKTEEQLVHDAFHDALTGLPNRALFLDRLQHVITVSHRRTGTLYAVLFLDMDRFKTINDSLGHGVGDQLLIAVGRRLAECIRPGDSVARLGGDEFAVLLGNIAELSNATDVAERIHKKLAVPFDIKGSEIFTSVSIGIAIGAERYERPEQVLRDADIAMYEAKGRGNSFYEVFDAKMHANILDRLQLEADLRGAIDRKELVLFYQPIIDLATQRLTGCEALIRWNHPKRGLVYPMEFIPLAEENGLIYPIGEWILREACFGLKSLQELYPAQPPLTLSINISSKQFMQQDLVGKLATCLRESGVDPGNLALEITESMIMENIDAAVETMNQLRAMGIHLHLDDFGTGYSSLSYLHRFPVNALKIDRSFIKKLTADGANKEIILSIVALAKSMNFDVIAEGVELDHQLVKIREMNCAYGQGFLFAHPMDLHDIDLWMQDRNKQA